MSGYDGPSIFKNQKSKSGESKIIRSSRQVGKQSERGKKIEKPSLKDVGEARAVYQGKRSSTPYSPKQLPSRDYFDKRYYDGVNKPNKALYERIYQELQSADDDLLLFATDQEEMGTQLSLDDSPTQTSVARPPQRKTGLNQRIEEILTDDHGHL